MSEPNDVTSKAHTEFAAQFLMGDVKGIKKYGATLMLDTPINAYEYAMSEVADLSKYLTLLEMRYRAVLAENAALKARLAADGSGA